MMATELASFGEQALVFGPFRLLRTQKALLDNGQPVRLGGRALDLLIALVDRAGETVSKDELIAYVWPTTFVEDNNLRVHMTALRKVLGDGQASTKFIINVPGRGYSFIAPVSRVDSEPLPGEPAHKIGAGHAIPASVVRMIGRDAEVAAIVSLVVMHRFVTIVGTGGVGKSTIAVSVANALKAKFADGARLVDLAAAVTSDQVVAAFASALGVSISPADPNGSLSGYLKPRQMLLVIDNCEQVADVLAPIIEAVTAAAPRTSLIATSREPLRVGEERLFQLSTLAVPDAGQSISLDEAMSYPSIQLFVERATATSDAFELAASDVANVSRLCRRLDGIPLAIELAAARMDVLSVSGLVARLDGELTFLSQGLRTARPSHQALGALLDWSYEALSYTEKLVFARLSVFRSAFTTDSAIAVCSGDDIAEMEVFAALAGLAAKSLMETNVGGETVYHRLLDTTRSYASAKLGHSEAALSLRARHAQHHLSLLQQSETDWDTSTRQSWLGAYGHLVDDVRAALDFAFGDPKNIPLGVSLAAAAMPLFLQLRLVDEAERIGRRALAQVATMTQPDRRAELVISYNLGGLAQQTARSGDTADLLERALVLSEELGQPRYRIGMLVGRWVTSFGAGDYDTANAISGQLAEVAALDPDPRGRLTADRVMAQTLHFRGEHARARAIAERVIIHPARQLPFAHSQSPIDRRVSMSIVIARILWLQGLTDQAVAVADQAIERAENDSPFSLSQVLALAVCPIALWRGDHDVAVQRIEQLIDTATQATAQYFVDWGKALDSGLAELTGSRDGPAFGERSAEKLTDLMATIVPRLPSPTTLRRARTGLVPWAAPEILRVGAAMLDPKATAARGAMLLDSIEMARAQGALSWELRATMDLAILQPGPGGRDDGKARLETLLARFREGHTTRDLRRAVSILAG
jgi:predicted ATPase/DNA-binding winged helix-turn-helix (wHTH) protein